LQVTTEPYEGRSLIRVEGECNVTSAAGLKTLLLGASAQGVDLCLDLERAEDIDIAILQLLWAAVGGAESKGARISIRLSEKAGKDARDAGFKCFLGEPLQV